MNGLTGFYQQASFQFFSVLFMKYARKYLGVFSNNNLTFSPYFLANYDIMDN